jgi:hypothetical protein
MDVAFVDSDDFWFSFFFFFSRSSVLSFS